MKRVKSEFQTERTYLIKSINKSIEKQRTSLSLAPMMDNEDGMEFGKLKNLRIFLQARR